jgi:threonyl-tRNA synthetase
MFNLTVNTVGDVYDEDEEGLYYDSEFVESISTEDFQEIDNTLREFYGLNSKEIAYLLNTEILDTHMYTVLLTEN